MLAHTDVIPNWLTRSVANSNAILVGILNLDIVVANSVVAVDRASSFCQCFKQCAIPLLQSTRDSGNMSIGEGWLFVGWSSFAPRSTAQGQHESFQQK